jgi:DHA1 family tetracycline resistance protein-like MFS transporter
VTGRSPALAFVLVTILIDTIGFGIVIPVVPELIMELTGEPIGRAAEYSGWLMLLFASVNFLAMPVLGNLSDRYGRRPVLLVSLAMLGINTLIMGLATSIIWLFIGRVLSGAAAASFSTANAYVADVSTPETRAQNFGMIGAAFGAGFVLGPAIGGLLGELGPRVPFFVAAGLAAVNVAYGWFVLPESLRPEHRRPFEWRRANPLGALAALRRYPVVAGLVLVIALYQLAFQVMPAVWSFYSMRAFDWSEADVGLSMAFTGVLMIVVQAGLVRRMIPALGEHRAALLGIGLAVLGHLGYAFAGAGWMAYAAAIPAAMSGLVTPSLNAIMSRQVGPEGQGELQGAVGAVVSLTAIVGPFVMTHLFSAFTSPGAAVQFPGAPFIASAALMLLALLLLARRAPEPQAPAAT